MKRKTYYFTKKGTVNYNEVYADDDTFEKFYEIECKSGADLMCIPDGVVDLQCLWKGETLKIYVCGNVKNGRFSKVIDFDKCFGARFHIGVLPKTLKIRLGEIIDNRIELNQIIDISNIKKYLKKDLFLEQKADVILTLFGRDVEEENKIINNIIKKIELLKGNVNVSDIIEDIGYSHRYVNYVFKDSVGISVKKYAEIVRMQESIRYLLNNKIDLVYDELGYYDQAHFIKDFKNFYSVTPRCMMKLSKKVNFI